MSIVSVNRRGRSPAPPSFDGYPYLVTRIGRSALRHLAVLPADWLRDRLVDLARRQADANRLDTCLVLGPDDVVYLRPGLAPSSGQLVPAGIPVIGQLALADPVADSPELIARRRRLRAFQSSWKADGYIVGDGLEGGRAATPVDIERLSGDLVDDLPPGLHRCATCGEARGELLWPDGDAQRGGPPLVRDIHCQCTNDNRCAACGAPLAGHRLSAWHWDDERASAWYLAAYAALGHRCAIAVTPELSQPAKRINAHGGQR